MKFFISLQAFPEIPRPTLNKNEKYKDYLICLIEVSDVFTKQKRMDSHYLDWVIYLNNLGEVTLVTTSKCSSKFHKSNWLILKLFLIELNSALFW